MEGNVFLQGFFKANDISENNMTVDFRLSRSGAYPEELIWVKDITIVCQSGVVTASSLLMILHSKLFTSIFEGLAPADSIIIVPDLDSAEIEELLDLMVGEHAELTVRSSLLEILDIIITVQEVIVQVVSAPESFYIDLHENESENLTTVENNNEEADNLKELENPLVDYGAETEMDNNDHAYSCEEEEVKPEVKFICAICDQNFGKKKYLVAHVKWQHCGPATKESQKVQSKAKSLNRKCNICGDLFNSRTIKDHMQSHSIDEKFQCEYCDNKFASEFNVKRHILNIHEQKKKLRCDKCAFQTNRMDNLNRHKMNTHSADEEKTLYECDICGDKMTRNDHMKEHRKTCQGRKKFLCEKCSKKCLTKEALRKHLEVFQTCCLFSLFPFWSTNLINRAKSTNLKCFIEIS